MAIVINGSGTVTGISVGGLPDDIVDAGTLADDAVGLAQMASGTDGNIITYDTSGNPAVVATGSDGQVLTSAGADAVPAFEAAGGNTPCFMSYLSSNQSVDSDTATKIQFNTEVYDSDGCYDNTTNYRFTPTVAGKYYITFKGEIHDIAADKFVNCNLYKNGTRIGSGYQHSAFVQGVSGHESQVIDFNGSSDYVEAFINHNNGSARNAKGASGGSQTNFFMGFRLIGT